MNGDDKQEADERTETRFSSQKVNNAVCYFMACTLLGIQEAQLSPSDRAMRLVSSNLANYHATVQKLLIRQVPIKPMV